MTDESARRHEAFLEDVAFQRKMNRAKRLTLPALMVRRRRVRQIESEWRRAIDAR